MRQVDRGALSDRKGSFGRLLLRTFLQSETFNQLTMKKYIGIVLNERYVYRVMYGMKCVLFLTYKVYRKLIYCIVFGV